jgi:hypothetical protein
MIKFKENVTGFIYDSINGDIMDIFTKPISKKLKIVDYDNVLFRSEDIEDLYDMFNIQSKEDMKGWEEVLEWID